ncbi:hypothetical protein [Kibdelosporangium aridum]|uniref:hypothetical protein n=1 Tax=Kibdelosporangium aridum TaxID=2030 RepID=UPI0005249BEB
MATSEEIERRIEEADAAISAKRVAAAKRVSQLAHRRAVLAEQLADVERELGDELAQASDVMNTKEMARFTDVPVADLDQWLNSQKSARPRRKKPASAAAKTPVSRSTSTETESGATQSVAVEALARVPAEVS